MECKRIEKQEFFWALQGVCTLHRTPWSTDLAHQQLAAPHTLASLCQAAEQFGFSASINKVKPANIPHESFPLIACLSARAGSPYDDVTLVSDNLNPDEFVSLGLVLQADREHVLLAEPGNPTPLTITSAEFARRYLGTVVRLAPRSEGADDAGDCGQSRPQRRFSFQWFIPELLKHKKLWQEILLASLVIQIIALTTPLFTQAIIDKVVVHHTQSTDRHRRRHGRLHIVRGLPDLAAPIPRAAHRYPRRPGAQQRLDHQDHLLV
jgi:subfamily B ATP-binding cassette protein HlyB/CyaB